MEINKARRLMTDRGPGAGYVFVAIIILTGLVLSMTSFVMMRNWETLQIQLELEKLAKERITAIVKGLDAGFMTLESIRSFYAASRKVERNEFRKFVKPALSSDLSIQALEWIPRVSASERKAYEQAARLDGFPEFRFSELNAQGQMVRASPRAEYFPVYFVEPYQGNEPALGFDLASDPERKAALVRSRDSGKMVATARIKLVQDQSEQFGFLTFLPIYSNDKIANSLDDRRRHLMGFVLGVFRLNDIVKRAMSHLRPGGVHFTIDDLSAPAGERFLYRHAAGRQKSKLKRADIEPAIRETRFRFTNIIDVAGRKWSIACTLTPEVITAHRSWKPWLTLYVLLLICGALATYFIATTRHRSQLAKAYHDLQREIDERRHAEDELRESRERFRSLVENAPDGILVYDLELERFVQVNDSISRILGYTNAELLSKNWLDISATDQADGRSAADWASELQREALAGNDVVNEWTFIDSDGKEVLTELRLTRFPSADRKLTRASVMDIGDRKRLEARLAQAQKMEAIANLAGGIAHEFNNALAGIFGNIDLLKMNRPQTEDMEQYLEPMLDSAKRMVRLTNQLLAYARGGKYQATAISLPDFVADTLPLIRHGIETDVNIETEWPDDIMTVTADTTQMQMLLFALLQNAAEAVDETGCIKITVRNVEIEAGSVKEHPDLNIGSHVCLSIEDDGTGMDEATRDRIFDPFFSTKFQGRGLGMAAVYGIVKNHDGVISVQSELNTGTVVRIYIPAFRDHTPKPAERMDEPVEGKETVLVVEDEDVVMDVNRKILEHLNYRVIGAATGSDAVRIAETFDGDIDLALLDIVLPDMGGKEIYPLLMKARPNLKVIVCSGYSLDSPAQEILDAGAQDFIQKPFSLATLASKLKKALSS